jgi:bifunctional N-acetylglucosamine-1-phosphate-uridyltransferase/glucosamine-1-phosphate-acetyltransferase GlmU-like protein
MVIRMRDSVLAHYHVTLEQFYASEEYYHTDIINYQKLLNKALDAINEEQNKLLQVPNSKANTDTKIKKN